MVKSGKQMENGKVLCVNRLSDTQYHAARWQRRKGA